MQGPPRAPCPAPSPDQAVTIMPSTSTFAPFAGHAETGFEPPLPAAIDLQDHLLVACHDLDRLQALLANACDTLLAGFHDATAPLQQRLELPCTGDDAARARRALDHFGAAVTALQFQDMAAQLITHTQRRLRHCADRLAHDAFAAAGDAEEAIVAPAPPGPNPVTQAELQAGSVELF
jgi:hypothetical protein